MSLTIRLMTAADVPFGMKLKEANGWNQLAADWLRFLDMEPQGCFVAEVDGIPIGTTCTVTFGDVAWVAMVLVDEQYRGQGIGTALMKHALSYLESRDISSIRLDATPLGRPVYEKLGFVAEYTLARYEGTISWKGEFVDDREEVRKPRRCPIPDALLRFDRSITGTDRGKMLTRFYREDPDSFCIIADGERVEGYIYTRPGSCARFLGPCLASPEAAPVLLAQACQRHVGEYVYMDVPENNLAACRFALAQGLQVQRHLLRMGRGPRIQEKLDYLWASSGPEKG